jgi:hypothetical protein
MHSLQPKTDHITGAVYVLVRFVVPGHWMVDHFSRILCCPTYRLVTQKVGSLLGYLPVKLLGLGGE